jgi:hypothetical protein
VEGERCALIRGGNVYVTDWGNRENGRGKQNGRVMKERNIQWFEWSMMAPNCQRQ